ncbi:hypothetical protein AVEN_44540-1 [Araneus ventricosus]|uniref:Uncharacterized protein n=1 Tax=Araneus ventricosus TaxID=182803 RepID=A0A4Y2F8P6_ARAVE|nr:hypothetical protein AVEN_44540-1 [Araneus ventricosus]
MPIQKCYDLSPSQTQILDSPLIPGCEDATEHTVIEWLSCDTDVNQYHKTDEEVISLVQNKPQDDSDEPENALISHSEASDALEIAPRYIEQSENVTSTDKMFMRRWHNIASTSNNIVVLDITLSDKFLRLKRSLM